MTDHTTSEITLAFYKGNGSTFWERLQDRAIRRMTGGIYSHVELVQGHIEEGAEVGCYSSSGRDGGVRYKVIHLKPENWDLVKIQHQGKSPVAIFIEHNNAKYDYRGILLSHVMALGLHSKTKWFCSEICAAALDIPSPERVSPQRLYDWVTWQMMK